ncbi:MAG: site-specific integrase [Clostridia bacterium]|nr:site-specific integrase [Clostridia bacterium]
MSKKRKKGAGTLRKRADGRWEARVVIGYDEKGQPITKNVTANQKAKCLEKLEKLKQEVGPVQRDTVKADMPFGEWIDFWYRHYCQMTIRQSTQASYENRIYKHIIPQIGSIKLNKLTQNDLQQFYANAKKGGRLQYAECLGEGLSDRMIRSIHAVCRQALEKAVSESLITVNPAIGCNLPPKKSREMQVLTPEEMQRFLIQAKYEGYFEMLLLELTTGMRRGELLALQWEDLNHDTGELRICRQVYHVKGSMQISEPKTKSSIRTIILPKVVLNVLAEYKKTVNSRWMFPSPMIEDMPRNPQSVYKKFKSILERAGCKDIRFHDLRHTFATTALANGMDVKTLSSIIGHVSSQTTLDIYLHSTLEMQRQAARKIDSGIAKNDGVSTEDEQTPDQDTNEPCKPKFEAVQGKIRRAGTGCITKINDNLYEGRYSPRGADGKRISKNIYAKTREECEILLAEMILKMKAEIQEAKAKLKASQSA